MLANSLSLKVIRGTLLAFRDQLGFSAFLLRSDNSFTTPLISRAYIVSAHHPAFPLVYTCTVSTSGSTGYQCDGAHRRTGRGGGRGGLQPPKVWATQIFWAARGNLGKASF